MKKITASILALALALCCFSTTAFAYTITDDTETGDNGVYSEIGYELESSYCINIPEYIDASVMDYYFTAEYLNIGSNEQVEVHILDGVYPEGYVLLKNDNGDELKCHILYNNKELTGGHEVGIFTDSLSSDGAMQLKIDSANGVRYTGKYTGTVSFNVAIGARN